MNDSALKNAFAKQNHIVERRKALNLELQTLNLEMARVEKFIRDWHEFADISVDKDGLTSQVEMPLNDSDQNITGNLESKRKRLRSNSKKEEVAATARKIILERGSPIMRDELYGLLVSKGMTIAGKDPLMVLSTMLWRMQDKILRVDGGGYWPADVENLEIGLKAIAE